MKRWILRLRVYWLASFLFEIYRLLIRPRTHGSLVALWCQGRLLLVEASYRNELSLPGGWINRNETPENAACRELQEELGLQLPLELFRKPWCFTEITNRGINTISFFSLEFQEPPFVQVDGLEILDTMWLTPEEALQRLITGHLRHYLTNYLNP